MRASRPPGECTEGSPPSRVVVGIIGLCLSLVPWIWLAAIMVIEMVWPSTGEGVLFIFLLILVLITIPLALLGAGLSVVGLLRDRRNPYAIAGTIVSILNVCLVVKILYF